MYLHSVEWDPCLSRGTVQLRRHLHWCHHCRSDYVTWCGVMPGSPAPQCMRFVRAFTQLIKKVITKVWRKSPPSSVLDLDSNTNMKLSEGKLYSSLWQFLHNATVLHYMRVLCNYPYFGSAAPNAQEGGQFLKREPLQQEGNIFQLNWAMLWVPGGQKRKK